MLLDSASLWYRAYYGMPDTLLAPDGTPVNAIRGYLDMTARLVGIYKPNRIVACLDGDWRPSWRVDIFPEYKSHRPPAPEDLKPQFPLVREAISSLNIDILEKKGFEADDIIATMAKEASNKGIRTTIISSDKDLMQLIDEVLRVHLL